MLNNVVLMGRIVAAPELKRTNNGTDVTSFTLAVERSYTKQGEERQVDFIDCTAWKKTAEFISKYFSKGSMIAVTGTIQTRNYEDKNGNKRKATEIIVDKASFCGEKTESKPNMNVAPPAPNNAPQSDFEEISEDDVLPF